MAGYPWFDYYDAEMKAVDGSKILAVVKSVKAKAEETRAEPLPENDSVSVPSVGPRSVVILLLFLWQSTSHCYGADIECTTNYPFPGVVYFTETRHEPPTRLFIAEVELTNANVRLTVAPGGPDPDGPGKWQTTLMTPTSIAAREGFDLVVNGDFFDGRGIKDAEGTNSHYRAEIWAAVNGPAVTGGRVWSTSTNPLPCLVVHKDRKVTIEVLDRPTSDDWEVVAGNTLLVQDGEAVPHKSKTRHPRTVVGLDRSGTRLILMVVDGRKPGIAVGMNYDELAIEMLRLGCYQSVNLDGGGSSVMAIRDGSSFHILNKPTDGHERPVANVLGISVGR